MGQRVDDRFGGDVLQWHRGRPTRETIDHSEEVVVAVGFWHHCYVDMYVGETSIGDDEFVNWRNRISANFGTLAVEASASPS